MKLKFLISLCVTLTATQVTASYSPSRIKILEKQSKESTIRTDHGNYTASVIRAYNLLSTNNISYQQYVYISRHGSLKSKVVYFEDSQIGELINLGDGRILTINNKDKISITEQ